MTMPTVKRFGDQFLALRIKGYGETGKGDREILMDAGEAIKLSIRLLSEADGLNDARGKRPPKNPC